MENCLFCKIVKGEIPCYKIYEDEQTLAFLDISKDYLGHTLIIPKKHYANIFDIPQEELNAVFTTVKKLALHFKNNLGFGGVNILSNNEKCSGQSVFHLHIHLIPRKQGDNAEIFCTIEPKDFDLDYFVEKFKFKA